MAKISDYLYRKASVNKIPLNGTFELSPVCNFSCKMCYVRRTISQIKKEGKQVKHWTEWVSLAEQCKQEGMLYLLLTGGEPFIYPHFRELYMKLHSMGFLISINTNGTMIDEETVAWLKNVAPIRVNVTLYGASGNTYEKICGDASGFDKAKRAILLLKSAGINVVINGSMIPENERDMEDIIRLGKENDIYTRISTYMFPPVRREKELSDSRCTPEQSADLFIRKNRCIHEREQYISFLRNEQFKFHEAVTGEKDNWGSSLEYMRCRAGRSTFWISWDGKMTACGMLSFPLEVYPFQKPFAQCWMELTNAVRSVKVLRECNLCNKKEICNPCVAMLYAETGDVNRKAQYLCDLTECVIQKIKEELKEVERNEEEI